MLDTCLSGLISDPGRAIVLCMYTGTTGTMECYRSARQLCRTIGGYIRYSTGCLPSCYGESWCCAQRGVIQYMSEEYRPIVSYIWIALLPANEHESRTQ